MYDEGYLADNKEKLNIALLNPSSKFILYLHLFVQFPYVIHVYDMHALPTFVFVIVAYITLWQIVNLDEIFCTHPFFLLIFDPRRITAIVASWLNELKLCNQTGSFLATVLSHGTFDRPSISCFGEVTCNSLQVLIVNQATDKSEILGTFYNRNAGKGLFQNLQREEAAHGQLLGILGVALFSPYLSL